jgi:hypothetical protein
MRLCKLGIDRDFTVANMASSAEPIASVTLALRSFILISMRGTVASLYFEKLAIMPLERASRQFAATMTQLMLASFEIQVASARVSSPRSGASLILCVALKRVARSSRASLRSFHLEDLRLVCKLAESLLVISSGSANARGSNSSGSGKGQGAQ